MAKIKYDPQNDYYKRLGLDSTATPTEIQHAYRRLAKEYHPDLNPNQHEWATGQFQSLNEAYNVLSNPTQKRAYDEHRAPFVWQAQGKNWWDQPHKAEPGYNGIHSQQPSPQPKLHPVHQLLNELFIESPYRLVLSILLLVFFATLVFIITLLQMDSEPKIRTPATPIQALPILPTEGAVLEPHSCPEFQFILQEAELLNGLAEFKVYSPNFIGVSEAQLLWVKLEGDLIRYQGQEASAKIRPSKDSNTKALTSQTLAQGHYLLRWLPQNGLPCDQLLEVGE